jgi:hypothetical protein
MADWWTIGTAIYAAIVATVALALEVRRWFESGPRLSISVVPEARIDDTTRLFLVATVANRGDAPTSITRIALSAYGSRLGRIRAKPVWYRVIWVGPTTINPGRMWETATVNDDELKRHISTGRLYVAIYASHSDKPIMKQVHMSATALAGAEDV